MRRMLWVCLGLAAAAGCRNRVVGPLENRDRAWPDNPTLPTDEQERRGRDRLTVPEKDFRTGPMIDIDRPGPIGR